MIDASAVDVDLDDVIDLSNHLLDQVECDIASKPVETVAAVPEKEEHDPVRILAALCANAPDLEVRDCLRKYSCENSLKRQKSVFNTVNKPVLVKCASYLHLATDGKNKPDIIHSLICKIQNLLPDVCQICSETYVSDISEPSLLACELCGQEIHKKCFLTKLGLADIEGKDVFNLVNPLGIPGIHYFCNECEKEVIPGINKPIIGPSKQPVVAVDDGKRDDLTPTCNTSNSEPTNSATCCLQSSDVPSSAVPPSAPNNTDVPSSAPNNSTLLECVGNGDIQNVFNNSRHPLDADHKNNQESLIEESTQNKLKTKICIHYKRNQCKHGLKGKHCPFLHPERCQKLMQNGTKSPDGCNLGKKCPLFHPKMCPSSISKRVCFDDKCTLTHVKGTKRKAIQVSQDKLSQKPVKPNLIESSKLQCPPQGHKSLQGLGNQHNSESGKPLTQQSGPSNNSFLDMINVLKKELCQAMDNKIAMSLSQIQHMWPPRTQSHPFLHPPFFHPTPTYQPFPPQFPPMLNLQMSQ